MKRIITVFLMMFFSVVNLHSEKHVVPYDIIPKPILLSTRQFGDDTELRKGEYVFSYSMKKVTIFWKWRIDSEGVWNAKIQYIDTTYEILEALAPTNQYMYVVGVTSDGETVVERWKFVFSLPYQITVEGEDPVEDWSLPRVSKKELYRGKELTHICDLAADPKGRFLLLITWESRFVYRMDINTGEYDYLFGPPELPQIQNYRRITVGNHETEGYIYAMYKNASWQPGPKSNAVLRSDNKYVWVTDTVIFRDHDRNGILDSQTLEYLTRQQVIEREYHEDVWLPF